MWSRPEMQLDRSKWRGNSGFNRSGSGGLIIWHLTRRRSRSGWFDITKRRPGGRLSCSLGRRLLGKNCSFTNNLGRLPSEPWHLAPDTCSPARYNLPVRIISRQKAIYFFLTLGVCLAAVAFAVGSGWIILNWSQGIQVFLEIIFFGAIVAGLVLNTIFLVREIRRNEKHDSFINAVTHELKTPIASIRLYLQTLQRLEVR